MKPTNEVKYRLAPAKRELIEKLESVSEEAAIMVRKWFTDENKKRVDDGRTKYRTRNPDKPWGRLPKPVHGNLLNRALELRATGKSYRDIARHLNRNKKKSEKLTHTKIERELKKYYGQQLQDLI